MLSEEEKKAIERFKANANYCITSKETTKIILNLIETQSKEIDLMAEDLTTDYHTKEWVMDYYGKKAREYRVETEEKK